MVRKQQREDILIRTVQSWLGQRDIKSTMVYLKGIRIKEETSENGMLTTYKSKGDELTMTMQTGANYTAKFDGKDYPFKGFYRFDTVSLKRLGDRSFEETDKLKGKVVEIDTWTVPQDGKTLNLVEVQMPTGRKSTLVFDRVPARK